MSERAAGARIAVVGSGIAGLSAAWLLSGRHDVVLYEEDKRLGGHSNTVAVEVDGVPVEVDTGFIVFNEPAYPNLTAMFRHLGVATAPSDMSFAVSLDDGRLEYAGTDLRGLFAQRRNLLNPRFWAMLRDLLRFYREAPSHAGRLGLTTLGEYLAAERYGAAFRDDHLLPMAAAIWSAPARVLLDYPAEAFIRFCENHGLLRLVGRPIWRTVEGGSRHYVERLAASLKGVRLGCGARRIERGRFGVEILDAAGGRERFDELVLATHADTALSLLADPQEDEAALLSAFRYSTNRAVLHRDPELMPKRRSVWASWNYLGRRERADEAAELSVTYWMNRLQPLPVTEPVFVSLNPVRAPRDELVLREERYEHPIFDAAALAAQRRLWTLQGRRRTWFCGAHFGAGFHEDGLQAGLAVAEALGGVRRPWSVPNESGRIVLGEPGDAVRVAA
jgi:predicted NAD/FAD-binding protein